MNAMNTKIANRIRELREQRRLTQEELAETIGVEPQQVWRYENGKSVPKGLTLIELADTLHASVDYILGRVDDRGAYLGDHLSDNERMIIDHLRHGDPLAAIKSIVGNQ